MGFLHELIFPYLIPQPFTSSRMLYVPIGDSWFFLRKSMSFPLHSVFLNRSIPPFIYLPRTILLNLINSAQTKTPLPAYSEYLIKAEWTFLCATSVPWKWDQCLAVPNKCTLWYTYHPWSHLEPEFLNH